MKKKPSSGAPKRGHAKEADFGHDPTDLDQFTAGQPGQAGSPAGGPDGQGVPPHAAEAPAAGGGGGGGGGVPLEIPHEAVKRLEGELEELQDRHARLAAEFDNYRKRINRERAELGNRSQGAFAIRLLDVLDDLDRILAGVEETTPSPSLHEALVLVDRKLRKELEAAGLERIDPVGEPFDPSQHEAVAALPPPSPEKDHTVSATFQAGYMFKGALIRPARVQVYSDPAQG